jgi:hypothetical protein
MKPHNKYLIERLVALGHTRDAVMQLSCDNAYRLVIGSTKVDDALTELLTEIGEPLPLELRAIAIHAVDDTTREAIEQSFLTFVGAMHVDQMSQYLLDYAPGRLATETWVGALARLSGMSEQRSKQTLPAAKLMDILSLREIGFGGADRRELRVDTRTFSPDFKFEPTVLAGLTQAERESVVLNAVCQTALVEQLTSTGPKSKGLEALLKISEDKNYILPAVAKVLRKGVLSRLTALSFAEPALHFFAHLAGVVAREGATHATLKAELTACRDRARKSKIDALRDMVNTQRATRTKKAATQQVWRLTDCLFRWGGVPFTWRTACDGVSIFGAIGSGKTSGSGDHILRSYLRAGAGVLGFCVKEDEREHLERVAREEGRGDDLLIISWKNAEERLGFNFLDYLRRALGDQVDVEIILGVFLEVMELTGTGTSESRGANQPFVDAMKQLVRHITLLFLVADEPLKIESYLQVLLDSAVTRKEAESQKWKQESYVAYLLEVARRRASTGKFDRNFDVRLRICEKYFERELPAKDDRFRSGFFGELEAMASTFQTSDILRTLFCEATDWTPEVLFDGKVVILDVDLKTYDKVGHYAAAVVKAMSHKIIEKRPNPPAGRADTMRPVAIWCDEAQNLFSPKRDPKFQATARSKRACTVYLTQGVVSYISEVGGGDGRAATNTFLQNLNTSIVHWTVDDDTVDKYVKRAGRTLIELRSSSRNTGWSGSGLTNLFEGGFTKILSQKSGGESQSTSQTVMDDLPMQAFTSLRCGGPENDYAVDGLVFTKTPFSSGKPWARVTFHQHGPVPKDRGDHEALNLERQQMMRDQPAATTAGGLDAVDVGRS